MLKRLLLVLFFIPVICCADEFVQGKDFLIVGNGSAKQSKKVTVTEFFSYGCPWCYRVEPRLQQWVNQQAGHIRFQRVPVVFNKDWSYYAKAYYTGNLLGLGNKFDESLFKAIQVDKKNLNNDTQMINFLTQQGISKDNAESALLHSTTIDLKMANANQLMGQYHVNAVPALIINGHYKVDLQMAQSLDRLFQIMDFLVAQDSGVSKDKA